MHKYGAHGSTDVTGFGLIGHAQNLVKCQLEKVCFNIYKLPVFGNVPAIAAAMNKLGRLQQGKGTETSGTILHCHRFH